MEMVGEPENRLRNSGIRGNLNHPFSGINSGDGANGGNVGRNDGWIVPVHEIRESNGGMEARI